MTDPTPITDIAVNLPLNDSEIKSLGALEEAPDPPSNTIPTVYAASPLDSTTTDALNSLPTAYAQVTQDNPLHDYESYTYCLSLHLMSIDNADDPYSYNKIIENPEKGYVPQHVLISSAGRYGDTFLRDPSFKQDFYFDNMKLKTVVNTTNQNRNTNLIQCSFTIIEPLGFTLINRLLSAAERVNGNQPGYLQMPYMLQIDFFGSSQDIPTAQLPGPIKGMTKYLPIRITTLKSKLSPKGTEYYVEAVPFNHQAYNKINVTNPAACKITGTTVKEIFGSGDISLDSAYVSSINTVNQLNKERAEITAYLNSNIADVNVSPEEVYAKQTRLSEINNQLTSATSAASVSGFTNAVNDWFAHLKKINELTEVTSINVVFDDEIGNSKLYASGLVNLPQVSVAADTTSSNRVAVQNAAGQNKSSINFNGSTITVPAMTTIDKLIDWAVRNSYYVGKQLDNTSNLNKIQQGSNPADFGTPLQWFKIVPKIKLSNYDKKTNRYSMAITFFVKKFKLAAKYPYAPQGRVPGYVKEYNYIFTGKNKDIVNCDIDFDTLYLLELTANKDKMAFSKTGGPINQPEANPNNTNAEQYPTPQSNPAHAVQVGIVSGNALTTDRSGADTGLSVKSGDLQRSLMLGARGDMITVNLRILGDPHFIKQDDVFYGQNLLSNTGQFISGDGTSGQSLWMDGGELYVFLNFNSPSDYDEQLGIANVDVNSTYSYRNAFRGVYKIITVESTFSNGRFEQNLQIVKLLYDQDGKPFPIDVNGGYRTESAVNKTLGTLIPNNMTRFSGPNALNTTGAPNNVLSALNGLTASLSGGTPAIVNRLIGYGTNKLLSSSVVTNLRKDINTSVNEVTSKVKGTVNDAVASAKKSLTGAATGSTDSLETAVNGIDTTGAEYASPTYDENMTVEFDNIDVDFGI